MQGVRAGRVELLFNMQKRQEAFKARWIDQMA